MGELLIFLVFFLIAAGLAGQIFHNYDIYLNKKKAYLGLRMDVFFSRKIVLAYTASIMIFVIYLILIIVIIIGQEPLLYPLWLLFIIMSCATYYLFHDQYRYLYSFDSTVVGWFWLGVSTLASIISSFWITERISSITGLPQGELPAAELLLSAIQFFVVLIFIFILISFISFSFSYVKLLLGRESKIHATAIVFGLLFISGFGPFLYAKTLSSPGFYVFFKGAIVLSSYSSEVNRCEETKGKGGDVRVSFIRNGEVSIVEYVDNTEGVYSDIIFSKSKCSFIYISEVDKAEASD